MGCCKGFKRREGYFVRGGRNGMGCFVRGGKNGMGCFVRGDKNCMGCFVRVGKSMRDVLSGVSKIGMGCFVLGCFVLHSLSASLFIVQAAKALMTLGICEGSSEPSLPAYDLTSWLISLTLCMLIDSAI